MCQRSKASPHPLQRQSVTSAADRRLGDQFGLVVGVRLDVAAVRGDDDEATVHAVVAEALDQLATSDGLTFGEVGIGGRACWRRRRMARQRRGGGDR